MDNKNITTYWQILDEHSGGKPGILSVCDSYGNNVHITEESPLYAIIDNLYSHWGKVSAEQIFKAFKPSEYRQGNMFVNEYHIKMNVSTEFEYLSAPTTMFCNLQYGAGGKLSSNSQYDMLSFESTYYIEGNKKYYLTDNIYLLTVAHDQPLDKQIYRTSVLLGLDDIGLDSQLNAVQVKYDIEDLGSTDVLIDMYIRELGIGIE